MFEESPVKRLFFSGDKSITKIYVSFIFLAFSLKVEGETETFVITCLI